MEMKTIRQNIKRQLGFDKPDDYLKMFNYQHGCCAMCLARHEKYDLVPDAMRLSWELRLVCRHCNHVLKCLSNDSDGLMREYMRDSLVRQLRLPTWATKTTQPKNLNPTKSTSQLFGTRQFGQRGSRIKTLVAHDFPNENTKLHRLGKLGNHPI